MNKQQIEMQAKMWMNTIEELRPEVKAFVMLSFTVQLLKELRVKFAKVEGQEAADKRIREIADTLSPVVASWVFGKEVK